VAAAATAAKVAAAAISGAGVAAGLSEAEVEKVQEDRKKSGGGRPKVVVLGSGWGAATFIKGLSEETAKLYDITVVSPRNFFLYTPLLPACTMGSIEERSIVTPVRQLIKGKAKYLEAKCEHIDTLQKVVRCGRAGKGKGPTDTAYERFPKDDVDGKLSFLLDYDILIYAVGAETNTFGTPGVKENAFFFKEMEDAHKVRSQITDLFERASLPGTTPQEKEDMLSFVVIGGGPTGVEVAADLADFVEGDARELYPDLIEYVKIRLVNAGTKMLSTYDSNISQACVDVFKSKGVEVLSAMRVVEVTPTEIKMTSMATQEPSNLKHGMVVWAAGIKKHDLTESMTASLIEANEQAGKDVAIKYLKAPTRGINTDEWLHVRGSGGSVFALGDAATVYHESVAPYSEQLFKAADINGDGEITMSSLRELFRGASDEFPQLEEYAEYLDTVTQKDSDDDPRLGPLFKTLDTNLRREQEAFRKALSLTQQTAGDRTAIKGFDAVAADIAEIDANKNNLLDLEEFKLLLERIDKNLQAFPPTAQVAAQQGKYLADIFASGKLEGSKESFKEVKARKNGFTYFHKGSLAYLGGGSAAFDLPLLGPVTGPAAGVAWKLYETSAQLSWKNRALVGLDWVREGLFGRDTSRY
jgi:NADH:ubiquinone reductase (non-electrogenic)